ALPFPLCLWEVEDEDGDLRPVSVARGNVVLADHGRALPPEPLPAPEVGRTFRPVLKERGLTQALPYGDAAARRRPAAAARGGPRQAVPAVTLQGDGDTWHPRRDLLASDRTATEFVVEMEDDGRAFLRFGDGTTHGRAPEGLAPFVATYRVGNGAEGNVGADS